MIDDNETFCGAAARELEEECGIKLLTHNLIDLGVCIPSAGGCDEIIQLYYCKLTLSEEKLQNILTKTFGDGEHE